MLTVKFSPIRADFKPLTASWVAPVLTVNGVDYDLSELPAGAEATHPVLGVVTRTGDDYTVTLLLHHGQNAPLATRFPDAVAVTTNGPIAVPPYDREVI